MRIMLRLVFSVLVFSLATLVSADSGWAKSFGQIASKHTRYQGKCLEADATGDWIIRLRDCDATKAQQWWFVTRAYPSDGTLKTDETIRSVMWPNRCMTDVDLGLDQGRVMVLRSCFDDGLTSSQLWEPKSLRRRIGTNGKCVSVAESKGFVRNCDRDSKRQRFDLTNVGKVTNFDLGDFIKDHPNVDLPEVHRFRDYADCAEQNQNETTCFINAGDEGKYGFRFGTEIDKLDRVPGFTGTQGDGDKVLDLGDRYSADRCALAHDRWYWASEDAANEEDFQIRPPTAFQEITIFKPDAAVLGGGRTGRGCWIALRPCARPPFRKTTPSR
jgi:hypothetical protein